MKNKKYGASYTVEAAYVMAVVFMAIAFAILSAFSIRKKVIRNYVFHGADIDMKHIEEEWREESCRESVEAKAGEKLEAVGAGNEEYIPAGSGIYISPETYLRMNTLLEDWKNVAEDE